MKPDRRRLIRKALKYHAPLSDSQLAWLMGHFEVKPATTKRLRRELTKAGEVRLAKSAHRNGHGQMLCEWELTPSYLLRRKPR